MKATTIRVGRKALEVIEARTFNDEDFIQSLVSVDKSENSRVKHFLKLAL